MKSDNERTAYDAVFDKYLFTGLMLQPFSPYTRLTRPYPFPPLPFDVSGFLQRGIKVPEDIQAARGYREFLELLVAYAKRGLIELRAVNPVTRGQASDRVQQDD